MSQKDRQTDYLQGLLSNYSSSVGRISDMLQQKQEQYEQKIKDGEYEIRKVNFTSSSTQPHKNFIEKFRNNRDQLSSQLFGLAKALKEEQLSQKRIISDQQRKKFVRQMMVEQKKLNEIKQQKLKSQQLKRLQIEQVKKKAEQNEARLRIQNKRVQIQRRIQQLSSSKERRNQEMKQRNQEYKKIASQKLLLHRMQQNYNKYQNETLEEKKKKLAAIRQIHKPMSKQQFDQHLQRIKYYKQLKMQEKQMESSSRYSQRNHQFYKSKWYREIQKEEKVDENKSLEEQKKMLIDLKDKSRKYSEYIRQNVVPEVDDKLAEEIAKRQPEPVKRKKPKEIRQMGLNNLQFSKQKILSKQEIQEKMKEKSKMNESTQNKPKPKNYLQELKINRKSSSLNEKFMIKVPTNLVQAEKIKRFAQNLEERAKRIQELKKVGKAVTQEQLDELYIKALDAKLNILKAKK